MFECTLVCDSQYWNTNTSKSKRKWIPYKSIQYIGSRNDDQNNGMICYNNPEADPELYAKAQIFILLEMNPVQFNPKFLLHAITAKKLY